MLRKRPLPMLPTTPLTPKPPITSPPAVTVTAAGLVGVGVGVAAAVWAGSPAAAARGGRLQPARRRRSLSRRAVLAAVHRIGLACAWCGVHVQLGYTRAGVRPTAGHSQPARAPRRRPCGHP